MTEIIEKGDFVVCLRTVKNLAVPFGTADIIEGDIYLVRGVVDCSCGRYLDIGLFTPSKNNVTICTRKIHYESEESKKFFTLDIEKNTIFPTKYCIDNWGMGLEFLKRERVLLSTNNREVSQIDGFDVYSPIIYSHSGDFKKVDISQETRNRKINLLDENI